MKTAALVALVLVSLVVGAVCGVALEMDPDLK